MKNPFKRNPEELLQNALQLPGFTQPKIKMLARSGDPRAVYPLVDGLMLEKNIISDQIRKEAIKALNMLKPHGSVEALIKWFSSDEDFRLEAVGLLTEIGEPKWQQIILGDDKDYERLGISDDPRAIIPLADAACRVQSVKSAKEILLKKNGTPEAAELVLNYCLDWVPSVRLRAVQILSKWGEPEFEKVVRGDYGDFERLGKTGDTRLLKPLIKVIKADYSEKSEEMAMAFHGENIADKLSAISILKHMNLPQAVDALAFTLYDKIFSVRESAAKALIKIAREDLSLVNNRWNEISRTIEAPKVQKKIRHVDQTPSSTDCHVDRIEYKITGIGLEIPPELRT